MTTISIDINGTDYKARVLPNEDDWQPAALRAVQRRFGKSASVWAWQVDCRQEDRSGRVTRVGYKATVVGKRERHGGGHPILAEVRLWVAA
jgi:hypothetical protein